uniref:Fungal lipase-like domain-containing protein n=1 Tax=Setaria italica TaxID=4555 RepID=K3ZMA3_SETIT
TREKLLRVQSGNSYNVTVELEGLGGGGTIEIEVRYLHFFFAREKQWWRIPFVSDFLVKSSLGSALRTVLGSASVNASQFVQSAFGQLSSFTYTYLPKPSSLESGGEVSESVEEPRDNAVESNNLQQQKIDSGDSLDSHCDAQSPAAAVNSEGDISSDEYWRALNNVLNQNVLHNFGFSLPEVKKLDGFDLLSSLGLKSREISEQKYLESGLATTDTSTSDGSETTPEDSVGVDNENGALTTKEEDQSSFVDINKVSRDVLSQTENILGALMILSKNLSPHDNKSVTKNETNKKDDMIIEQEVAAAEDSIDKDNTVASTKLSVDAQKAEDMRHLFASAETAMEAWAMLATSLGCNSFIKSDFEKICFLDNVSTDTQIISTNVFRLPFGAILHEEGYRLNPERLGGDFKQEVQVHSGFLGAYDFVTNRIMALIKFAVGYQDEEDAENIPRWHVYVTGHSLVSRILSSSKSAILSFHRQLMPSFDPWYVERGKVQVFNTQNGVIFVTMYNFGSPRVGNRRFAEVYNALTVNLMCNLVFPLMKPACWNPYIIPTVPRLMGYCHVEAPVYLKFGDSKDELVNNGILYDEDQGDVIGEYTPDVLVTEFMKGEKQLVEKLLQTEINLLRSIRDGSALMQHMEDFYYVTLLENVRSRYQVVDSAIDESR